MISNATDLSLFKDMFPVSGVVYTFRISVVIFGVLVFFDGIVFFVISSRSLSADSVPRTNQVVCFIQKYVVILYRFLSQMLLLNGEKNEMNMYFIEVF